MERLYFFSKKFDHGLGKVFSILLPVFMFILAIQIGRGVFMPVPMWVTIPAWIIHTGFLLIAMVLAFGSIIIWIKRKKLDWY